MSANLQLARLVERASCLANFERLRSGFVPTRAERAVILVISDELSELLGQPHPTDNSLSALHARATSQLALNLSILSPIRRLPPEFLSAIFVSIIPRDASGQFNSFAQMVDVAGVCCAWRALVRSIPSLWTHISSWGAQSGDFDYAARAQLAAGLPLHLSHCQLATSEMRTTFLAQLQPHAARWASVDFGFTAPFPNIEFRAALPALETVTLCLAGSARESPCGTSLGFLQDAPALKRLTLHLFQDAGDIHWGWLALPEFPYLTSLEVHVLCGELYFAPEDELLLVLRSCRRSLVFLSLDILGDTVQMWPPSMAADPLQLESLRSICLEGNACHAYLGLISAPRLEDIKLRTQYVPEQSQLTCLVAFSSRQRLPVKRLTLDEVASDSTQTFVRCLELLADMEELYVREPEGGVLLLTVPVLRRLTCVDDAPPLLPRLSKVVFDMPQCVAGGPVGSALRKMLGSRRRARTCAGQAVAALGRVEILAGHQPFDTDFFSSIGCPNSASPGSTTAFDF
ncbi:hypothetical protein HDZ31DRAFT_63804 [Schizophyllum fasciatum]